ncbi:MAG TPA: CPBP family intramembrane glutamic endopeptidase [Gemmatimonadales bacterium]|nr:CPBP family intramembrane glutamic endopeptidase [Gemmatimonadales bacterium]
MTEVIEVAAPAPRLTLPKAIAWSIAFVLLGLVLSTLLAVGFASLVFHGLGAGLHGLRVLSPASLAIQGLSSLLGFVLANWALGLKSLRLTRDDLRWFGAERGAPGFGIGLALGILAAGAALVLAAALGGARWSPDQGSFGDYVLNVAKTTVLLAPAAFAEEFWFRGTALVLLAAVIGRWRAVVLVAVVFGLMHLTNPNVTGLGVLNIALAGVLLGAAFYSPGGMWAACGLHLGWNATLAALDAPVSGLPFRIPFLDYHAGGPAWLTGGPFGPEGGLAATLAIAAATYGAGRWTRHAKEQA